MKKQLLAVTAVALGLTLTACGGSRGTSTFATVNGEVITQQQYDMQLDMYKSMLATRYNLPTTVETSLIQKAVMLQDLKANKVEITQEMYNKTYDDSVKSRGGVEAYKMMLQSSGITDEQMRESLKFQTIFDAHKEMYMKAHMPSDAEIKDYFEKNKELLVSVTASHILVKTEAEAKAVRARLDKGEDFAAIAKEVSTDKSSAVNGGSLGEASPTKYVQPFRDALASMKAGDISAPVKSEFGYHIIRLEDKKDSMESLKDAIVAKITAQAHSLYVQELISKADVKKASDALKQQTSAESRSEKESSKAQSSESQASESSTSESQASGN